MPRDDDGDVWDDDADEAYDDSVGYAEDEDEDEEYEDFVRREFGGGRGGSQLSGVYYVTAIVLLIVFLLPLFLYLAYVFF